jgi:hypothetical protein
MVETLELKLIYKVRKMLGKSIFVFYLHGRDNSVGTSMSSRYALNVSLNESRRCEVGLTAIFQTRSWSPHRFPQSGNRTSWPG